jgi:hypothetical protein
LCLLRLQRRRVAERFDLIDGELWPVSHASSESIRITEEVARQGVSASGAAPGTPSCIDNRDTKHTSPIVATVPTRLP